VGKSVNVLDWVGTRSACGLCWRYHARASLLCTATWLLAVAKEYSARRSSDIGMAEGTQLSATSTLSSSFSANTAPRRTKPALGRITCVTNLVKWEEGVVAVEVAVMVAEVVAVEVAVVVAVVAVEVVVLLAKVRTKGVVHSSFGMSVEPGAWDSVEVEAVEVEVRVEREGRL